MFENVGEKIKMLAKVVCWVGIFLSVIVGGRYVSTDIVKAILASAGGSLLSWIGSFLVYGFGELVDKTRDLAVK